MNNKLIPLGPVSGYPTITIADFIAHFPHVKTNEEAAGDGDYAFSDYHADVSIILLTGDVFISQERLKDLHENFHLKLAVDGNLHVDGAPANLFYVSGDVFCTSVDLAIFDLHEPVGGAIAASDCAWIVGEEPALVLDPPLVRLETPYLFACWYRVGPMALSPSTVLFICGEWWYSGAFAEPRAVFIGAPMVFVLDQRFLFTFEHATANEPQWRKGEIESALRAGEDILRKEISMASVPFALGAADAILLGDYRNAYLLYKQAAAVSPGDYTAWCGMADALFSQGAFAQALPLYQQASALFPDNQTGMVNEAAQNAALCAVRCGDPATAVRMATLAIGHATTLREDPSELSFAYELRAEAYLQMNDLALAGADLTHALAIDPGTGYGNWLMGALHYRRDELALAAACQGRAVAVNSAFAAPYASHAGVDFLHPPQVEVDWTSQPGSAGVAPVRDEAFWGVYLRYQDPNCIARVPVELRTPALCMAVLEQYSWGPNVSFTQYFPDAAFTREMAENMVRRSPSNIADVPARLVDAALLDLVANSEHGLRLSHLPPHMIDHAVCLRAVMGGEDLGQVPPELLDDAMRAAAVLHIGVHASQLPAWATRPVLRLAVATYKQALDSIPCFAFDRDLYELAHATWGVEADWPEIVARHGQAACLDDNFWTGAARTCWRVFWDEAFILRQMARTDGAHLRPEHIAPECMTRKVAEACLAQHPDCLEYIPAIWISQSACERFIAAYPKRLGSVPVAMRTASICAAAMQAAPGQLALVPIALRSVAFCVAAVRADSACADEVPNALMRAVFAILLEQHGDELDRDWLTLRRGDGALCAEPPDIDLALADFHTVAEAPASADFDGDEVAEAQWMIGYCHHLRGMHAEAALWREKSGFEEGYDETGFDEPVAPCDADTRPADRDAALPPTAAPQQAVRRITSFDGFERLSLDQFEERFPDACVGERRDPQEPGSSCSTDNGACWPDSDALILLLPGDVMIDDRLLQRSAGPGWTHIVVEGDLYLEGRDAGVRGARGIDRVYFVGGDLHARSLDLTRIPSNAVAGRIVTDCAWLWAEDDCAMRTAPELRLDAGFLFAWFYTVNDMTISPHTVIFILGNDDYCDDMGLPNPVFQWHEDIYVLAEPFVCIVEEERSDTNGWVDTAIEQALARGESILRHGVDMACYPYHRAAQAQASAREHRSAYLLHKKSAAISPGFYPSWLGMGRALFSAGAYEQALDMFIQAGTLFPAEQTAIDNRGYELASLSAVYLGRLDDAIAWATLSIAHNEDAEDAEEAHGYAYRCRGEAHLLAGSLDLAFADLQEALKRDRYDWTSHWLLGQVHYQRGEHERARFLHGAAARGARYFTPYYDTRSGTAFLYPAPCQLDWDQVPLDTVQLPPAPDHDQ
ncbi:tetratricopeptide repeat protein [Massilia violaceinigra]|uniref:Tetratricopeptide repeat protein n=1 Tax=Massilia violaceinigra TaxID=2045208 RepID=A0ABY4A516_9BURK|nr:tetratricopeptide repeat protein [Massilia violaceinigra]UOD28661.1 tetratricopeptide repeat protein [Massilia violaceinigra]